MCIYLITVTVLDENRSHSGRQGEEKQRRVKGEMISEVKRISEKKSNQRHVLINVVIIHVSFFNMLNYKLQTPNFQYSDASRG